ncbi:DUF2225 domain-containing protein [Metabacillus sp. GX 13764]|uniref:DUF2225 domain-containing protein n=1 Tax=Metabacillus kandeliae TaxID=2900151 RepID=UPI001E34ED50|nr:DUF2225 domain-containing protein [Metabacillus kandeliae]MCD7036245.1 DUF2225 domain-containing protein [Metabacillus kandeliae]
MNETDCLYDKHVKCLVCSHGFTTKKLRSKYVRPIQHDTDFCSYYDSENRNPLYYYITVCPECGYSFSDEFSSYFPPRTLDAIEEKVWSNWGKLNYCGERDLRQSLNTYKLAIYCAQLKQEKHVAAAGIFLRLAWLYRTEGKTAQEFRFMQLAADEYTQSYSTGDFKGSHLSEVRVLYLAGELNRRLGRTNQATLYFSRIIERQKEFLEKSVIQMAKDQWQEIRAEKQRAAN